MKIKYDAQYGEYVVVGGADKYEETVQAYATGRLTDQSRDIGYTEYKGRGYIDSLPVVSIYLVDNDDMGECINEDEIDWDAAMDNGRIIVDTNALTDGEYAMLRFFVKIKAVF